MRTRLLFVSAWREVLRAKGRTLLVVLMVALPLAVFAAIDVVATSVDVPDEVAAQRALGGGGATALLTWEGGPIVQQDGGGYALDWQDDSPMAPAPPDEEVAASLGRVKGDVDVARMQDFNATAVVDGRVVELKGTVADWTAPLTARWGDLRGGRLPSGADEVMVNDDLAGQGAGVGTTLSLTGRDLQVVGILEDPEVRNAPRLYASHAALPAEPGSTPRWLVRTDEFTRSQVAALNAEGFSVRDPAQVTSWTFDEFNGPSEEDVTNGVMVAAMALLEVVLLAGPAFAVSARRKQRDLALLAIAGGSPRQVRQAVTASAWVLGALAVVLGLGLGVGAGWIAHQVVQAHVAHQPVGLRVNAWHLGVLGSLALLSAVVAALVPAWLASRRDAVHSLASGRSTIGRGVWTSAVVGGVMLLLGASRSLSAIAGHESDRVAAFAGLVQAVGVLLLLPVLVHALSRVAGGLPLPLRHAVRDASRHRTRTVPAVAATMGAVLAMCALSIGVASTLAQEQGNHQPIGYEGDALVSLWGGDDDAAAAAGDLLVDRYGAERVTPWQTPVGWTDDPAAGPVWLHAEVSGGATASGMGVVDALVTDTAPARLYGLPETARDRVDAALAAGSVVVFTDPRFGDGIVEGPGTVEVTSDNEGRPVARSATILQVPAATPSVAAHTLVPTAVAGEWGLAVRTTAFTVAGAATAGTAGLEAALVKNATADSSVMVEDGPERQPWEDLLPWGIVLGAGLLVVGGTLTATRLALADAADDLATLGAVGASPATRRTVAAATSLVIAGVGSALGLVLGLLTGAGAAVAVTRGWAMNAAGHYLVVPWAPVLVGAVGLPLLVALLVGLLTRSREVLPARVA